MSRWARWTAGWRQDLPRAVLSGGAQALALSPWCAGLATWLPAVLMSMGVLGLLRALAVRRGDPARAGRYAWWHGSTWLLGATGWTYVSLHTYGGLPAWLAVLAVLGLCLALSIYLGLAGWAWARWASGTSGPSGFDALLWGALWLLAEVARADIFTGFPWGASGYVLLDTPLTALAPWVGVYGMGAVWVGALAWVSWAPVQAGPLRGVSVRAGALAVGVGLLAWSGPGRFTQPQGQPLSVSLIQGNVPQAEKFAVENQWPHVLWHARQLVDAPGRLVVAPETAITYLPQQLPEGFWPQFEANFAARPGRVGLIGIPLGDETQGFLNAVVTLTDRPLGDPMAGYRYAKHHLVPFGEFIPAGFRWFVDLMNMPLGDFSRGPLAAPSLQLDGQRVAPTICYEDLYGEEIATRFVRAEQSPTLMVNVSNLAWFGESVAIHQHLQIARLRSLEFQVPTARATNTGATVIINERGEVTHALATNTQGVLNAPVQGMSGVTPFAWWAGRFSLWPWWLLGATVLLWAVKRQRASAGILPLIH